MSPFADTQPSFRPSLFARFSERRTPLVFLLCLVVGLGLVAWRVIVRAETARAIARTEARARGASLELQLSRLASAAEVLGALAKQGRVGLTNFQRVATELLSAHPGLASLDLEPGGVVSDIAPRAGHERAVGFSVLKDAAQRVVANEIIARRVLTLAGPVTLDHGEQGIVARLPIFQRTSDGRDSFWGFVAASMRLRDFLGKPQTDELVKAGYNFALLAPAPGQQKAIAIASHGLSSVQDTVQQPVRAQNLEFNLALKPPGGWVDKTKMVLESLLVVLMCALASLSFNLLESRRATEADLREAAQRLDREVADRNRAREDIHGTQQRMAAVQAELKHNQLALQQAESKVAELQSRLRASDREKEATAELHEAELKKTQEMQQKAQGTIVQLQSRLDAAIQGEKEAASSPEERLKQNQAATAELQDRLEEAARTARETAKTTATTVAQLEQSNRELKARLLVAEEAETRVSELNGLLQKAQEELRQRKERSPEGAKSDFAKFVDIEPGPELSAEIPEQPVPLPVFTEVATKVKADSSSASTSEHTVLSQTEQSTSPSDRAADSRLPSRAVEAETPVTRKMVRAPKQKKAGPHNQLHLFGDEASATAASIRPSEPKIPPAVEPAAPLAGPIPDRPKITIGKRKEEAPPEESSKRSSPKPQPESAGEDVQAASARTPPELPRHLPPASPVDPTQLRKAVNLIVPLLVERDPGAKECVRDNRKTFRSAFTPEAYVEFEQLVRNGNCEAALEQLKKAARKHGISA